MAYSISDNLESWAKKFEIHDSTLVALKEAGLQLESVLRLTSEDISTLNDGKGLKMGPKNRLCDAIKETNKLKQG